eukprot:tig00000053_g23501.t1
MATTRDLDLQLRALGQARRLRGPHPPGSAAGSFLSRLVAAAALVVRRSVWRQDERNGLESEPGQARRAEGRADSNPVTDPARPKRTLSSSPPRTVFSMYPSATVPPKPRKRTAGVHLSFPIERCVARRRGPRWTFARPSRARRIRWYPGAPRGRPHGRKAPALASGTL